MALSPINTSNLPRKRRLRPGETPLSPVDVSELPERRGPGGNFLSSVGDALQAGSASGAPGGANAPELSAPDPVNVSQFPDRKQQFEEGPSGFQEVVGTLGDAISVGAGADPVFRQGQQQRKLRNALTAFQNNPEQGLAEVMQVSPEVGLQLQQQQTRRQQVQGVNQQREFERGRAAQLSAVRALKSARDSGADMGQAFDRLAPAIQNMGVDQQQLQQLRQTVIDNPQALDALEQGLLDPSTVNQQQRLQASGQPQVTGQPIQVIDPETGDPALAQQFEDGTTRIIRDDTGAPINPARFKRGLMGESEAVIGRGPSGVPRATQIPGSAAEAETAQTRADVTRTRQQIESAEEEASREQTQRVGRVSEEAATVQNVDEVINSVSERVGSFTAGLGGSVLQFVPGTDARDLAADLETIRANVGFDRLQQMRDLSPTGGALGQVSEIENRLLQNSAAALDLTQSPTQLRENLQALQEQRRASFRRTKAAFEQDFGVPVERVNELEGFQDVDPTMLIPRQFLNEDLLPERFQQNGNGGGQRRQRRRPRQQSQQNGGDQNSGDTSGPRFLGFE